MTVRLEPHNKGWATTFAEAANQLMALDVFDWVEHIGSTSVQGLVAKPIIDIMAGVRPLIATEALVNVLSVLGYVHRPHDFLDRETFRRDSAGGARTHHLHVVPASATAHHDILFRDRLRRIPDAREEYERLKLRLAEQHGSGRDRRAYSAGKTEFIQRIVDEERVDRGLPVGGRVYSRRDRV